MLKFMKIKTVEANQAAMSDGEASVRPYNIGLDWDEVVLIHGFRLSLNDQTAGTTANVYLWSLVNKNLPSADDSGTTQEAPGEVSSDNELLACGYLGGSATAGQWNNSEDVWMTFRIPLLAVRGPSLQFHNASGGSRTVSYVSSLYYSKEKVGQNHLLKLIKGSFGRLQTRVPNVPETIDE